MTRGGSDQIGSDQRVFAGYDFLRSQADNRGVRSHRFFFSLTLIERADLLGPIRTIQLGLLRFTEVRGLVKHLFIDFRSQPVFFRVFPHKIRRNRMHIFRLALHDHIKNRILVFRKVVVFDGTEFLSVSATDFPADPVLRFFCLDL